MREAAVSVFLLVSEFVAVCMFLHRVGHVGTLSCHIWPLHVSTDHAMLRAQSNVSEHDNVAQNKVCEHYNVVLITADPDSVQTLMQIHLRLHTFHLVNPCPMNLPAY